MSEAGELPSFVVCPTCRGSLQRDRLHVRCSRDHVFEVQRDAVNFTGDSEPGDAQWTAQLADEQRAAQRRTEQAGVQHRVDDYLLPYIDAHFDRRDVRLLDDGAGYGDSVKALLGEGVQAYGIDPGARTRDWLELGVTGRLFVASGRELPFADGSFDMVISSGVLEHVGEHLPEGQRGGPCAEYVHELIRVLRPGGRAVVAQPNGRHPFDYWHAYGSKSIRAHSPWEDWMPRPASMRSWVGSSPIDAELRFLSPNGYLAFDRVRAHAYGRAFAGGMQQVFKLIDRAPRLASSWLNPWLVAEIVRTG